MKKLKRNLVLNTFLTVSLIFFLGCHNPEERIDYEKKVLPVDFLTKVKLSELVNTVNQICTLQSNNTPLLGKIDKIQRVDSSIVVFDKKFLQRVLRFDLSGKYLNSVGSFGEAEGEYSLPRDFTVADDRIEIFDKKKYSILKFTLGGQYLHETNVPFSIYEMEYADANSRWIYTAEDGPDQRVSQTLYLVDSSYTTIKNEFFPYKNGLDDVPFPNYLIKVQNGIRFTRPLVGEFYLLEAQSGIDSLIHVDYSPYTWSYTEDELSINDERIEGDFYKGGVMSVAHELCETSDYLVFRTFKVDEGEQRERINEEEDLWLCIYHKKADKLIAVKEVVNDLDSTLFARPIYAHDDQFYGVLYPEELLQNHAGKVISDGNTTIAVDSLSMEQNPILVKYRFNDKLFYQ